jgi:hypothetical protein
MVEVYLPKGEHLKSGTREFQLAMTASFLIFQGAQFVPPILRSDEPLPVRRGRVVVPETRYPLARELP